MDQTPLTPPPAPGTWPKAVPLLVLAGLLAYANSFTKAFVLDDIPWITGNPDLADADRYFTLWNRPVLRLSLLLNYRLGGLNPVGYHAFNLAVHVLAGLTLYGLVPRALLQPRFAGRYDTAAPYLAFATALLWLVHPLQTQAVTYVVQRCESMMGLFYLFAFYAWTRGATGGRRWYTAAVVSFLLSFGSKEVAITLPPVLLIFDRIFLARSWRELVRERWLPYVGLFGIWCGLLRPYVLGASGDDSIGGEVSGVGFGLAAATPYQYLLTQAGVILHYLRLCFWPVGQVMDYLDWPVARSFAEVWPQFLAVAGLLLASLVGLFVRPAAGFVGFWFFATLAPTSSILPIIDPAFEHRMYLSLAAVAVAVVFAAHALLRKVGWPSERRATAAGVALTVAAVSLIGLTIVRNETYRTYSTLLETDHARRPNNPRPLASLAAIYMLANELDRADEVLRRATPEQQTLSLLVRQRAAWLALVGRLAEAERYDRALLAVPYNPYDTPIVHRHLAWVQLALGKPSEAAQTMRALMKYQPEVAENHLILAAAELAAGRQSAAAEAAAEAARLDPTRAGNAASQARTQVLANQADTPATQLNKARALGLAAAACLADGDRNPAFLDTLAIVYAWTNQFPKAAEAARRGVAAAKERGDTDWATALAARQRLYEAGKPYRPAGESR